MEGISLADAMALSNRDDGFNFGGVGGLILILLFFLIFGNGFNFGGHGYGHEPLPQVDRDVLTTSAQTQKDILESRYNTQMGFQDAQSRLDSCCCQLSSQIHSEGEQTRALITQNTIDDLRDRLNSARDELGNLRQTASLISALRPAPIPAYPVCSPYTTYGFDNGCNGGCGNI